MCMGAVFLAFEAFVWFYFHNDSALRLNCIFYLQGFCFANLKIFFTYCYKLMQRKQLVLFGTYSCVAP